MNFEHTVADGENQWLHPTTYKMKCFPLNPISTFYSKCFPRQYQAMKYHHIPSFQASIPTLEASEIWRPRISPHVFSGTNLQISWFLFAARDVRPQCAAVPRVPLLWWLTHLATRKCWSWNHVGFVGFVYSFVVKTGSVGSGCPLLQGAQQKHLSCAQRAEGKRCLLYYRQPEGSSTFFLIGKAKQQIAQFEKSGEPANHHEEKILRCRASWSPHGGAQVPGECADNLSRGAPNSRSLRVNQDCQNSPADPANQPSPGIAPNSL